ncbi:MAG: glutamyl-tRNA reductase [Alphaproteobacteria bacterium]|nr:glutamyl-tRNA reductase [Alphaproteobacteria bacterium]
MSLQEAARVFVVGANHRSSTALLRDRLFIEEAMMPRMFDRLRSAGVEQAVILSTCDRTEVQGVHNTADRAARRVRDDFAAMANMGRDEIVEQSYTLVDEAALRHIFAVASSLDSQVIGEPQVLGQVRASHRLATDCGMVGPELDAVLQAAYGVAKRVRSETDVARRPVSIASAAVQVAQDLHGDLSDSHVLVVGLGEIGELVHEQLRVAGLRHCTMTGPSERSEAVARRAGFHFTPFDDLVVALGAADIVVTALGSGRRVIDRQHIEAALKVRRRKPMLLIDGGVPADVDETVEKSSDAFLYTLDDLERVAQQGRMHRQEAADAAWRIVDRGVEMWNQRQAERSVVPSLVAMRMHFESMRERVLEENPNADAAEATRLLVNRLLHQPSLMLRQIATADEDPAEHDLGAVDRVVRRLFGGSRAGGDK